MDIPIDPKIQEFIDLIGKHGGQSFDFFDEIEYNWYCEQENSERITTIDGLTSDATFAKASVARESI